MEGRLKKHNLLWQRVNIGDTYRIIIRTKVPMMIPSEGTYLDQYDQQCKGWAACYMDDLIDDCFFQYCRWPPEASYPSTRSSLDEIILYSREKQNITVCVFFWVQNYIRENTFISRKMCLGLSLSCQYVRFLDRIVGNNELAMDPKNVLAIITMPCPKAQEESRVF